VKFFEKGAETVLEDPRDPGKFFKPGFFVREKQGGK